MKYLEGFLAMVGLLCCMAVDSPDQWGLVAGAAGMASFAAAAAIEEIRR